MFAFFSPGVTVGGLSGLLESFQDTIALGMIAGLFLGKAIGITATSFLVTRFPGVQIDASVKWIDMIGMAFAAGIGFTVSLFVGELSFGAASDATDHVKVGVLTGSLVAALIGGTLLSIRNKHYRRQQLSFSDPEAQPQASAKDQRVDDREPAGHGNQPHAPATDDIEAGGAASSIMRRPNGHVEG